MHRMVRGSSVLLCFPQIGLGLLVLKAREQMQSAGLTGGRQEFHVVVSSLLVLMLTLQLSTWDALRP